MKNYLVWKFILGLLFSLGPGCEKFGPREKYRRPDWLPGKLYTAVKTQDNLTLFAECLRLTGLDTILDVSGSFTVFAPTDEAMELFLSENQYAGVSDIPADDLERLTEFHIIQNPWSLEQLQSLGIYGWRTGNNSNRNYYAYKRQTIFKNPVRKYWIARRDNKERIVLDSTSTKTYKRVFVASRKYVPIFYDDYMDINGLTSEDFSFYFDRPYEPGNVYYAGARIIRPDIFAENGFVHIIDRVVNPMMNAQEFLEREIPGESYKLFLEMIYWYYPAFSANMDATFRQPEVRLGGLVDTLWDLNYPDLAFDIQMESTGYEGGNVNETMVLHNGLFIPTDAAFREFIEDILTSVSGFPHWPGTTSLPRDISRIIVTPHFRSSPIYPSTGTYEEIFGEGGSFRQDEEAIVRKEFGSNCTFIGLDTYIPNRVFTSVTGPVFLRPEYSIFRRAMEYSGMDDFIADQNGEICFFPIPDNALNSDSSMMLNWISIENDNFNFVEFNRSMQMMANLSRGSISSRMRNHVGTSLPEGSANKEFIRTLGGNYIVWDHSNNTVRGNRPSTVGFNGSIVTTCVPVPLNEPADNGKTWSVNYWFNFENINMRGVLLRYPTFFNLLLKADLVDPNAGNLTFLDRNGNYTVFVPSEEALDNYQADTLSMEALGAFLKYHFLSGTMVFTDNKLPSGNYPTAAGADLVIQTGPDLIEILDSAGNPYVTIAENENSTNIMVTERSTVSSVVHEIDKVLIQ